MQIVRTIVWVVIGVLLVSFTVANWQSVPVHLGGGLVADTNLPLLVIGAFLLGLLPTWLLHKITRWRMGRRISNLENSLAAQLPSPPLATSSQLAEQGKTEAP